MALEPGTHVGAYRIVSLLGTGGMGEVYRARDLKLGREVAIKVLPHALRDDRDRLARFEREAHVLASLNHPNIAHIYGVEDSAGTPALVMELVEGSTLADRMANGHLSLDEALAIATQIAEGLEAAHEHGIIHRDLKPANIKIRDDGAVKILDFGLAKALEPNQAANPHATQSPTLTTPALMTGAGVVLGTAAYMAPEQARGRLADHRSDIFAFGCVLYEMLAGRRAFPGDEPADVLACIMKVEPDYVAVPATANPRLSELLRRALQKQPRERWQAIGDVRAELKAIARDPWGGPVARRRRSTRLGAARIAVEVVGAVLIIAFALAWFRRPITRLASSVTRFSIELPLDQILTNPGRQAIAISPDGTSVAYVANERLYLRNMSELDARPIAGTQTGGGVTSPTFSPDGQWIAFWGGGKLQKIAIAGGVGVTLCDAPNPSGMAWSGNQIYFGENPNRIMRVDADGGKPEAVVIGDSHEIFYGPQPLPGGHDVLLTVLNSSRSAPTTFQWDSAQIVARSLVSGASHVVLDSGGDGRYVPSGHLVYATGDTLMAAPFDIATQTVTGARVPIVDHVRRGGANPAAQFAFSATGSLAYITSERNGDRVIVLAGRSGDRQPLSLPAGSYNHPRLSPDGRHLAVQTADGSNADIWVYDLGGASSLRRLTFQGRNSFPVWTPDSQRVVYMSEREGDSGLFSQPLEGGASERLLKAEGGTLFRPETWSPDGKVLLYSINPAGGAGVIWSLRIGANQAPTPLIGERNASAISSAMSPDGHWIAYTSTFGAAQQRLYVQPFPPDGGKFQVSAVGAHFPRWSRDGRQLFFATDDSSGTSQLMVSSVTTQPNFSSTPPVPIGVKDIVTNRERGGFDVMPDGQHFVVLMLQGALLPGTPPSDELRVTLNWFDDLRRRVPSR